MSEPETTRRLLRWWDGHRRVLPWRASASRKADPYAVWLSEIMLQQTTVATVDAYFRKFLLCWPDVAALAAASQEQVLAAWAGLGYYARARNLHACAAIVVERHGGRFPRREEELLRLPGVGPYTAAAIAAIAFDEPCVAVDGNVERVISRLFAVEEPLPAAKPRIKALAAGLLPTRRPGDFAQALMDLGATVCAPRSPKCPACPLSETCAAHRAGAASSFPVKPQKQARPRRRAAVFVLRSGELVLVRRRAEKGLLGGMTEFPSTPLAVDLAGLGAKTPEQRLAAAISSAPLAARWRETPEPVRHVFTHFALELTVFVGETPKASPIAGCRWAKASELKAEALPTVMRKAARRAGLTG
ncbi:MAG TPA: A/G-specific adenine glycosylase [Methylocystis sp.]|nr:A/G-specific adenine glycosylase [Methylocystis sp.]